MTSPTSPLQDANHAAYLWDVDYIKESLRQIAQMYVWHDQTPTEEELIERCDTAAYLAEEALDVFEGML